MVDRPLKNPIIATATRLPQTLSTAPKRPLKCQCHMHCLLSVCLLVCFFLSFFFLPVRSKVMELEKRFEESQADLHRTSCSKIAGFVARV